MLVPNPVANVAQPNLCQRVERLFAERISLDLPVDILVLVADRNQNIQRAMTGRCQCIIRHTGVLNVERRIFTERMQCLDLGQVLLIIATYVNVMVRQIVITTFYPQIQHVSAAGVSLSRQLFVVPTLAQRIGHQPFHRFGEIGVHDKGVAIINALFGFDAHHPASLHFQSRYRFVQPNIDAQLNGNFRHPLANTTASADRMMYPVFIFQER